MYYSSVFLLVFCLPFIEIQKSEGIGIKCGNNTCLTMDGEQCGICARKSQSGEDGCMYPFNSRFSVEGNKSCSNGLCWEGSCDGKKSPGGYFANNDSRCLRSSYATNVCACKSNKFGYICQNEGQPNRDIAKEINPIFKFRINAVEEVFFFVQVKQFGYKAVYTVSSGEGDFKSFNKPYNPLNKERIKFICDTTIDFPIFCYILETYAEYAMATLRFPLLNDPERLLFAGDKVAGYLSTISLLVDHPELADILGAKSVVFNKTFTVFIKYPKDREEVECTPIIHLSNCGSLFSYPQFYPTSEIQIFATIENPGYFKVCETTVNFSWKVWRVELNTMNEGVIPLKLLYGSTMLFFPPYKLQAGKYKIEFETSFIHREKSISISNFGQCFFGVGLRPLVAIIDGAPIVYWHDYKKNWDEVNPYECLYGSRSYDPNSNSKEGISYHWSCAREPPAPGCNSSCELATHLHGHTDVLAKISGSSWQQFNCSYGPEINFHFTLTVRKAGVEPGVATVIVKFDDIKYKYNMQITCISCKSGTADPTNVIILQVHHHFEDPQFVWEYAEVGLTSMKSAGDIAENGTGVDTLKIKENALKKGRMYNISVTETKINIMTYTKFTTPKDIYIECEPSCDPPKGKRGTTLFKLKPCQAEGAVVIYEFYDKADSDEALFSGRMLATSNSLDLQDFRLVKTGQFVVYVFDSSKMASEIKIPVQLVNDTITQDTFQSLISEFQDHASAGEGHLQNALRLASVITEAITPELEGNHGTLRMILTTLKDFSLTTLADEKLYLSSLHSLFVAISKQKESLLTDANYGKQSSIIILKITNDFVKRMFNLHSEVTLTTKIARQMIRAIFHCIEVALKYQNAKVRETPKEYVDPVILELVQSTSYRLVTALDKLMNTVLKNQLIGDTHSELESSDKTIYSWVKAGYPESLANVTRITYRFPMSMSNELVQSLKTLTINMGITFLRLKKTDPFWWAGTRIDTDVLMVMFCAKSNVKPCEYIDYVKYPLLMFFNITETISSVAHLEGKASCLSTKMSPLELDLGITVYRLDLPLRAMLFIEFSFENQDNKTLTHFKVLIQNNKRPDYVTLEEEGQIISASSPFYNLTYDKSDTDRFYYMSVLPLTPKGLSLFQEPREKIEFKVKMYYMICLTWVTWQWTGRGCYVGQQTNGSRLVCECTHFSMFGGTVGVPELKLDPALRQSLLLTLQDNLLPLLLVLGLLALCLLLVLWAVVTSRRKQAKMQGDVIVLEDNYPGERYAFLLGVFTGSRINAGTEANVGVKLYGEAGESRPHILRSSLRKTLRGNSDDWFLLYCPRPLGDITQLHIWHDDTGYSPDWFVEKVEVYDLTDQMQYLFELNLWLALEMNEHPEAIATPASVSEIYSVKNLFVNNVVTGLRDTHYWTSIFWRHPRNPVTRVERIAVVMCFIVVAMAVSILSFSLHYTSGWREDLPAYMFGLFECFVFLVSFCCASITACLVMSLFRKSYSLKTMRSRSTLFVRKDNIRAMSQIHDEDSKIMLSSTTSGYQPVASSTRSVLSGMSIASGQPSNQLHYYELSRANLEANLLKYGLAGSSYKNRSICQRIVGALHTVVRGSPLAPVKLPDYNSSIIVHSSILIAAWLVCYIVILLSLVTVISYGKALQPEETFMWLTVFIAVLVFDALVVSTLKILVCSTILSFMLQKMDYINNYQVDPKHASRKHLRGDLDHLFWLLDLRSQRMYCPMPEFEQSISRERKVRRMQWRKLLDFLVVLLLILVLVMLSFTFTRNNYPSNRHSRRMITIGQEARNVKNFNQIVNRTDFELFIKYKFIGQLYRYMWYNLAPLVNLKASAVNRKEWAEDCVTRLLGTARMRQLRVAKGVCSRLKRKELWNLTADCSPSWSVSAEDRGVYGIRWGTASRKDVLRTRTDWKWTAGKYSNSSRYYGQSATLYHRGGFISDLGYTKQEAELVVGKLIKDHWLDHYTRAVFVELTLYNVNTGLFSQLALVAEQTPFGLYLPLAKVQSVTTQLNFNLWNISFVVFLIFFLIRMCILMNRSGIFTYLSNNLNVYEVFLLSLGFLTAFLYIIHIIISTYYMQEFERGGMSQFFSFFKIVNYSFLSKAAMCLLIACVVVRMFISWHFGRIFISFYYTFWLSRPWIFWLMFYYIISLVVMWRFVGYFLNIFIFSYYSSVIIYYKDFSFSGFQESFVSKVVVYCMCILSLSVLLLFVTSFVHYYRVAKQYRMRKGEYLNYITFSIQQVCRRKK